MEIIIFSSVRFVGDDVEFRVFTNMGTVRSAEASGGVATDDYSTVYLCYEDGTLATFADLDEKQMIRFLATGQIPENANPYPKNPPWKNRG